jgi:hypothetical protein
LEALQARGAAFAAPRAFGTVTEVREKFPTAPRFARLARHCSPRHGQSHLWICAIPADSVHPAKKSALMIEMFKLVDLEDFIGVEGLPADGEPTLKFTSSSCWKSLRPCPKNGTDFRMSRRVTVSAISIFSQTAIPRRFRKADHDCAKSTNFMEAGFSSGDPHVAGGGGWGRGRTISDPSQSARPGALSPDRPRALFEAVAGWRIQQSF